MSEGNAHLVHFSVNGLEAGTGGSEIRLNKEGVLEVSAKGAALLSETQDAEGAMIARRPLDRQPYWHIERARIGTGRKVRVELIVNGKAVDTTEIGADGGWKDIRFQYALKESGTVALRIFPAAHTNPVFVLVNNKKIGVAKSALWCRQALDQCWKMKAKNIREEERGAAEKAYTEARKLYDELVREGGV